MLKQAFIQVKGDVTRVGFRAMMRLKARECNITGTIQNVFDNPDLYGPHGGVEMVIQGDEEAIKDMVDCIKEGSTISRVDDIEIQYQEPQEIMEDFTILKSRSFHPHL